MSEAKSLAPKAVLFCTCSGACPSMQKVDFWALAERVRLELGDQIRFLALHPRLCEEDGEQLMGQLLRSDLTTITPACAVKRQERLLRDGFGRAGVTMDSRHWVPVSMAMEETGAIFDRIRAAVEAPATG